MDAIDYREALDKFCYVSQQQQFYNKVTGKKIKEASVRKKIQEIYPKLANQGAKLDSIVSEIKNWSYTPEQVMSARERRIAARRSVYEKVKADLPMLWQASVSGENKLFYVNSDREVTFSGQVNYDNFVNIVRGASGYLAFLKQVHKAEDERSRFEDFLSYLFREFQFDPEKQLQEEPPIITHDPVEYAYKRFNPDKLQKGETPTWDEFLNRLDFPEQFLAWVWSIFEPKNKGRQILWLQGQGNDGKSTAIQTITDYLGEEHSMPIEEGVGSQFFYSKIYGKRLATFGDCKSPRYIAGSKVHSLVGGDYVSIERKGEQPFSAFVRIKLLIASNLFPQIDFSMPNEYTRLMLIKVGPNKSMDGDIYFKDKLMEEKWQFLYKCKEAYKKHCPADAQIAISEKHFESMKLDCGSEESGFVNNFVSDFLIFEKGAKVRISDLKQKFDEQARMAGFPENKLGRMKRDLESQLGQAGVKKAKLRFSSSGGKSKIERAFKGVKFGSEVI